MCVYVCVNLCVVVLSILKVTPYLYVLEVGEEGPPRGRRGFPEVLHICLWPETAKVEADLAYSSS